MGYTWCVVTKQALTPDEYLALPEQKPYLEYVCGEAVPKMAPDRKHGALAARLVGCLLDYQRARGGETIIEGRVEFQDGDDLRFLLPDISFFSAGRPVEGRRAMLSPTLAIEIRSPDQPLSEQRDKCHFYRRHGVDVAWLVDPVSRAVEVFEAGVHLVLEEDQSLSCEALPGLALPLTDLFEGFES